VEIGSVNGQSELDLRPIDLAFTQPPAGTWQIVLMLREWTAAGFVTRDFTNFATPFLSAREVDKPCVALVAVKPVAPVAAKAPAAVVPSIPAAVAAKAPAPVIAPVTAKASASEVTKAVASVAPARKSGVTSAKGVSVNTARVEELAAVKGLSSKLAESIVKQRPFVSLDDLRRVKGLGAKILAKVRSGLKL
jgi:DNA uptake protein ComE-like DNA-binding protein